MGDNINLNHEDNIDTQIAEGLKKNLRFYPEPNSIQFQMLPPEKQREAIDYFEKEQDRVDRLMREWESGQR